MTAVRPTLKVLVILTVVDRQIVVLELGLKKIKAAVGAWRAPQDQQASAPSSGIVLAAGRGRAGPLDAGAGRPGGLRER